MDKLLDEFEKTVEIMTSELKKINAKNTISPQELVCIKDIATTMAKLTETEAMLERKNYNDSEASIHWSNPRMSRMDGRNSDYNDNHGVRSRRYTSNHSLNDRMIANLESMMDNTDSEYERRHINDWINRIRMGE